MSDAEQDKHDFDSSTGSSCSPGNKLSYWGQKIKDQIIDGDGKALESTLMGHAETIEERFSYRFKDNDYDTKALTFLILAAGLGRYAMVRMLLASGADENAITSSGGSPASFLAAEMGYLEILKVFFHSQRALVMETKNKWKQTALMRAASFGRLSIIEFLLENLANTAARDEDGSSAFLMACMNGHLGVVERFMELRPEVVDEKDDNGRNGLLCAAVDGKLSVVEYLMKKPAMIETKDLKGDSAFTLACMAGHLNVVERLMELRPEVAEEKNDSGRNGLLCAAIDGNVSIVEYLMKTPAMMKPRDESGDSAFTLACYFGHLPVVKELIANTPEVLKEADNDGRTGLLCAAWNDKLEIVQYLINDKDAKFDDQDESGFTVLHLASHRGNVGMVKSILQKSTSLLEITSVYGQTPLLSAAEESKPAVAQILLQNGADIKHQNNQKDTALHIASRDGSTELARALIESSKDPLEIRNASHQTPLLTAVTNKHYDIVDILLGAGANINAQDDNGRTALSFAAEHGNQSLVKTLVGEKKAILDIQDNSTKTALLLAVENGSPEIVSFLLQAGANIEARSSSGETALHYAAKSGNCRIIQTILDQKAFFLDLADDSQRTPLLIAAENKQRDAVNLLLKSGADLWTKDEDAWTVFHYAARSGDLEIVQELLTQNPSFSKEQNNLGQTGLVIAANNLQSSVVDFLFNHENENHSEDEGFAVLTYAITEGHLDLTKSILQRFSRLASRKNESGDVPLFTAIKSKELDVIEYILTVNVDLGIKDGRGSNLLHCATKNGLLDTMKFLLTQKPDLINERDSDSGGRTPLTIAIWKNEDSLISLLLQNKANVNVQDDSGDTALHSACRFSSPEIVQKLIEAGAEPTTTGEYDSTPLHHAARSGNLQKVDMILEWLSDNSKGRWTVAEDTVGDTPLNDAIIFEQFSIAFKLLGSHSYFPKHPSDDKIYISSQREREKVANWLIAWAIDSTSDQIREHVSVVAYWAILNDQQELLSAILKKGKLPRLDSQDGSTWAHIAALGNNYGALETHSDWPLCLLDRTKKRITPLYLAAKRGNLSLLHRLLNSIDQVDSARALEAIIHETEEKETLLSITAAEEGPGEKSSSLNMLWDNLCSEKMRPAMKNTLKSFNANTDRLMEQAARRYIRGASDSKPLEYLLSLVQDIHGKPNSNGSQETKHSSTTGEWTILQLVVYYQFPLALWCLLSSRRYNREIHIMECNAVNGKWSKHKKELTDIIGDILVTPPPRKPLDTQLLPKNLEEFCKRDRLGTLSTQQGSILDLFTTENHKIAYQHKQAYLKNIIYDEGPDEIMRKEGFKDFRALRDRIHSSEKPAQRSDEGQKPKEKVKPDLKSQPAPADGDGALKNVTSNAETEKKAPHNLKDKIPSSEGDSKEGLSSRPLKKYRWIHLPVNDLDAVGELMHRLSYRGQPHIHQSLTAFVKQSWSELPVGGGVTHEPPSKAQPRETDVIKSEKLPNDTSEEMGRLALYMPYLSWSTEGFLRTELLSRKDDIHEHEAELNSVEEHSELYQRHVSHSPVSLDQYYYVGLQAGELQERNSDQVMSRYLKRSATLEHNSGGSNGNLNTTPENARTSMSSGSHEQAQITQPNDRSEKQEARHAGGRSKEGLGVLRTEGSQGIPSNDRTATDISESIASQILVINQLWLWVLDDNTIITSSTKNDTKVQETFLHQVLLRIQAQKTASESLLGQIVEIIVETATTSFYDINIRLDATGKAKRSPMDIFRESLQTVRNEETNLFDKFERSLEEDKTGQQSNSAARQNLGSPQTDQNPVKKPTITRLGEWWESLKENELENRYQNIQNETRLLREIKDILDELRILKELANDQEHVNGLWKKVVDVETNRRYTIKETKDDIDNMIQEAKSVEDAINTLLDLKQKQATILEARATRQQSDTVMVFTVVTIVFLPASFLTSLFALNVKDFPHQGDSVSFEGRWIFPIIFCVSLGVSTFFIWLAFNAHLFKHILGQTWNGLGGWSRRPVKSDSREQQDVAIKANHFKYLLPSAWGKQENEANKSVEGNSCEPHQIAPGQFRVQDESLQEDGQMSKMSPDNDKRV